MAKQTFTAGQVLTAAEMNSLQENDYNWTVTTKTASYTLAAGDEGTRIVMNNAGATTITVDDAVFSAGDVVWIHNIGAGTCTVTAGTATVNTAASLDLAQWEGGSLFFTSASSAIFFRGGGVDAFAIEYVVIAGGGAGGAGTLTGVPDVAGGGGAGGYVSNVSGENSGGASTPNPALYIPRGDAVFVSVGAGGTGATGGSQYAPDWTCGTSSYFGDVWAVHGGRGGGIAAASHWHYPMPDGTSGSNGGQGDIGGPTGGIARQGSNGGGTSNNGGGGGGGSGANGSNGAAGGIGGAGGAGTASSITGSSVTRGGGGGGGASTTGGAGGAGGGGAGSTGTGNAGTANTGGGGGGGGGSSGTWAGGNGGSGVIILKWLTADATPTIGAGLTTSSATSGDYTVLTITAGTDTITWN